MFSLRDQKEKEAKGTTGNTTKAAAQQKSVGTTGCGSAGAANV